MISRLACTKLLSRSVVYKQHSNMCGYVIRQQRRLTISTDVYDMHTVSSASSVTAAEVVNVLAVSVSAYTQSIRMCCSKFYC